jgi:hypothetical protein
VWPEDLGDLLNPLGDIMELHQIIKPGMKKEIAFQVEE